MRLQLTRPGSESSHRCWGRNPLLSGSLKKIDDETLITEVLKRGYNLSDPQENETTAEIIRIGEKRLRESLTR